MKTIPAACTIVTALVGFLVGDFSLAADIPGNLAPNPSFELPENGSGQPPSGWTVFASKQKNVALTDTIARSGRQSLAFSAQGMVNAFAGVIFTLPASEGEKFDFEVSYTGDKTNRPDGTLHIMLLIEWKRADGTEIARTMTPPLKAHQISRLRWESMALRKAVAPKDTDKAIFGIHCCDGERGGRGTVYFDDVVILRK